MQHRIYCPILFQLLYGQSPEQVFLTKEIGFQRGNQQTLAEASGTAQKVNGICIGNPVNQIGLINVDTIVIPQLFKILYPDGIASESLLHVHPC